MCCVLQRVRHAESSIFTCCRSERESLHSQLREVLSCRFQQVSDMQTLGRSCSHPPVQAGPPVGRGALQRLAEPPAGETPATKEELSSRNESPVAKHKFGHPPVQAGPPVGRGAPQRDEAPAGGIRILAGATQEAIVHGVTQPTAEWLRVETVQHSLEMQSNLSQRLERKRRSLEILEQATPDVADLSQEGPDVIHGAAADDFRAEIAQDCLAMESQLVQRLGELAVSGQSFKFDHLWR